MVRETGTVTASTTDGFAVNVLDPHLYVDPWDAYRWLRDEAPVYWDPLQQLWAISRYDDVLAIEKDTERYSSFNGSRPNIDERGDESMINLDDPEHQAQRNLVARRFSPARCGRTRTTCASRDRDPRRRRGPRCMRGDRGHRIPAAGAMIAELLGYPPEWWEHVRHWSEQIMLLSGPDVARGATARAASGNRAGGDRVLHDDDGGHRSPPARTARRPDLGVGAGGMGRQACARRDGPRARRRRRDDPHRDRDDDPRACVAARSAGDVAATPGVARNDRDRGVHPLGVAGAQHAAHRDRRPRAPRPDDPRRRPAVADVRVGEPGSARSTIPIVSTSRVRTIGTSRSDSARTSASARRWHGSRSA